MNSISFTKCISVTFSRFNVPDMLYGTPSLAGVSANVVSSDAMTRSQERTSSHAPPQTEPSTIARTGVGWASMRRTAARSGSS